MASRPSCAPLLQILEPLEPQRVEGGHGLEESFEVEIAPGLGLHEGVRLRQQALGDQDLARLGLAAETGGEVRDGADGAVVPAPLEADRADRRVALRDADAELELVAELAPREA